MFMKELDDEFEDIEDQLFNQEEDEDKSHAADDMGCSDLENGEETNSKQNKKLTSKMKRKMNQINQKKLKQLKKIQYQRQRSYFDRIRKGLALTSKRQLNLSSDHYQASAIQALNNNVSHTHKSYHLHFSLSICQLQLIIRFLIDIEKLVVRVVNCTDDDVAPDAKCSRRPKRTR